MFFVASWWVESTRCRAGSELETENLGFSEFGIWDLGRFTRSNDITFLSLQISSWDGSFALDVRKVGNCGGWR